MIPYRMNPLGIRENIPLTLTAEQANSTVKITATGSPTVSGLHYRRGKSGLWLPYTIDDTITLSNVGDSVQFMNAAPLLNASESSYVSFALSGLIAASGNLMSMISGNDCASWCFYRLFNGQTALTTTPDIIARNLADYCLYAVFRGCSRLTTGAKMDIRSLAASCCYYMYQNCTGLLTAPPFPFLPLYQSCFARMYQGCSALTAAPEIKWTSLVSGCFSNTFRACSALEYISVDFTSWSDATPSWVIGVKASGTFVKPSALPEEYGESKIPSGWTVVNK